MDETSVRQRLDEVRAELARLDDERAAVIAILRGYETWLRVHGTSPSVQMPLPLPLRRPEPATAPVSAEPETSRPSYRSSVLRALQEAHGEPLHTKEIAHRAVQLGGKSGAKDPVAITDLVIHSLAKNHPVRKVSPRTWVLDEPPEDEK
jgi:hypothetical protein